MLHDIYNMKEKEYGISSLPANTVVAMAYVPYQKNMNKIYTPEQGLDQGTLFPVLDKPFLAAGGDCHE